MSIKYEIPRRSRFLQPAMRAVATFNVPTPGVYDFAGQAVNILTMEPNALYFIERINVGGDIPEEEYLFAIQTLPTAQYFDSVTQQQVFPLPLALNNYIDNQETNAWAYSDQTGHVLQLRIAGVLRATPFLIGVVSVALNIQSNIYEITDTAYIKSFRDLGQRSEVGAVVQKKPLGFTFQTAR